MNNLCDQAVITFYTVQFSLLHCFFSSTGFELSSCFVLFFCFEVSEKKLHKSSKWNGNTFFSYHPPGKRVPIRSQMSFVEFSGGIQSMDCTAHLWNDSLTERKKNKKQPAQKEQLLAMWNKMHNSSKMNDLHLNFQIIKNIFTSEMLSYFKLSSLLPNNNTFFFKNTK